MGLPNIELIENETKAIIDGETATVNSLHSGDHNGNDYLVIGIEEHGEFISYDDGETWSDIE